MRYRRLVKPRDPERVADHGGQGEHESTPRERADQPAPAVLTLQEQERPAQRHENDRRLWRRPAGVNGREGPQAGKDELVDGDVATEKVLAQRERADNNRQTREQARRAPSCR